MNGGTNKDGRSLGSWRSLGRMMHTDGNIDWFAVARTAKGELVAVGDSYTWRYFDSGPGLPEPGWYPHGMVSLKFLSQGRSSLTPLADGSILAIGVNADYRPMLNTNHALARRYVQDAPQSWHWEEVSAPPVECISHAAVLLDDGTVMVAGGTDPNFTPSGQQPVNAMEYTQIFDPRTNAWRIVQPLSRPRQGAVLVPLGSGRSAMIIGGTTQDGDHFELAKSAEIFLEGDGWHPVPPMRESRSAPSAVRLRDGRIVVAGGDTVETYNPRLERWEDPVPVIFPTGARPPVLELRNRTVLIGVNQIYDPVLRRCERITLEPALHYDSFLPCCSTRSGAAVVLAPKTDGAGLPFDETAAGTAWSFDASGGSQDHPPGKWIAAGNPPGVQQDGAHMLAALPGGHILATDKSNSFRYDRREWKPAGPLPILMLDRMFSALVELQNGSVLAIGFDKDFATLSNQDFLLTSAYTQEAGWSAPSRMVAQRGSYASARMRDGSVLVAGGFDLTKNYPLQNAPALASAEIYDAKARMWRETIPMNTPRMQFAMAALPDRDAVLVFGGKTGMMYGDVLSSVEMYGVDEGARAWIPMAPMKYPRVSASALGLPDGRIVVASEDTLEVFDPHSQMWEEPVELLFSVGAQDILGLLRDGTMLVGVAQVYDPVKRECRPIEPMPTAQSLPSGYCTTTLTTVMVWPEDDWNQAQQTVWEFDIDGR